MKLANRMLALGLCAVGVTVASLGCGDGATPSSPVAPSASPAALAGTTTLTPRSVQTAIDEASLGTDTVDLKSTAATPSNPINNAEVDDLTPSLTAANARGLFGDANFNYAFAVYKVDAGGMTLVETGTAAQDVASTTYEVQMPLDGGSSYQWRVRPFLDGAYGPWSALTSFTTPVGVVIGPPIPTFPINGETVSSFRPIFNVTNGPVEGDAGEVIYQIQVALDSGFSNIVAEVGTHSRSRGDTNIPLQSDLMPETHYYWRGRGRNDGQGKTALLPNPAAAAQVVGEWTATQDFHTPTEATAGSAGGASGAPGKGQCCPPSERLDIVLNVISATGSLFTDDVQQFTEEVARCLAVTDGDWGRRLNDSGVVGKDTVAYRVPGSSNPYSIDILQGATSSNPIPHWSKHGQVGGSWFAVDATKCVLGNITVR